MSEPSLTLEEYEEYKSDLEYVAGELHEVFNFISPSYILASTKDITRFLTQIMGREVLDGTVKLIHSYANANAGAPDIRSLLVTRPFVESLLDVCDGMKQGQTLSSEFSKWWNSSKSKVKATNDLRVVERKSVEKEELPRGFVRNKKTL